MKDYYSNNDNEIIKNVIQELMNYNVYDLLTKIAALNLLPENQNKCVIFDTLINAILCKDPNTFNQANKIGSNKLKQLVNMCMSLNSAKYIDPIDMPYIQRVFFYGNKWVFSGVNTSVGFIVQNFLDILFKDNNGFNEQYIHAAGRFCELMLSVSTQIVETMGYSLAVLQHHERHDIVYPNNYKFEKIKTAITISATIVETLVGTETEEDLETKFGQQNNPQIGSGDDYNFFYHPFLRIAKEEFLVLNPSMLGPFLVHYLVLLAEKYNEKEKLIKLYNEKAWYKCKNYLKELGHNKIKEASIGFSLINQENYKEILLNVANDGIMFVRFFCDDGRNYEHHKMFDFKSIELEGVEERIIELQAKMPKLVKNKIYQLVILNNFGRPISATFGDSSGIGYITLTPFELECVSINEREHKFFLPRYIESKRKLLETPFSSTAEYNYLTMYSENEYSFYVNDQTDTRKTILFPGYGDSIDYIHKALKKEDRQLIETPDGKFLVEIVFNDAERNIYCDISMSNMALINSFSNVTIWTICENPTSAEDLHLKMSLLDLTSYWLGECKVIIEDGAFKSETVVINNVFLDSADEFFVVRTEAQEALPKTLKMEKTDEKTLTIYWTPTAFHSFINKEHSTEKELMSLLIDKLAFFLEADGKLQFDDKIFRDPLKTKMFSLNFQEHPYLKPIDGKMREISSECTSFLLDEIGDYLLHIKGIKYGIIKEHRNEICIEVVGFLYDKLVKEVEKYKAEDFYFVIYNDLEIIMYQMMLMQKRYALDLACYPEKSEKIQRQYNHLNESSIALKFLMEYVAAIPPKGDVHLGEMDFEYLLAICALIIEWAHNGDLFYYNMISNPLEMLRSGRIGFKKEGVERLARTNLEAAKKKLNGLSNPEVDMFASKSETIQLEVLDKAYAAEYGYTYSQFYACGIALIEIGEEQEGEINSGLFDEVCLKLADRMKTRVELVKKIINDLSLTERSSYLKPEKPYMSNDVYPWKFNRKLSFNRRPIIKTNGTIIWGNRQLYHCLLFMLDLINEGRLKVDSREMKEYLGHVANKRGDCFNEKVFEKLSTINGIIVRKKIKKINGKKVAAENGQDLGDIDVLIIKPDRKKIIVVETKDFSFSKTPYEMHQEYLSVFCDNGKKLCYISKHKRRLLWVQEHINDVLQQYSLVNGNWKVQDLLITSDSITSNEFYHQKQKMLLFSEITASNIHKL